MPYSLFDYWNVIYTSFVIICPLLGRYATYDLNIYSICN